MKKNDETDNVAIVISLNPSFNNNVFVNDIIICGKLSKITSRILNN